MPSLVFVPQFVAVQGQAPFQVKPIPQRQANFTSQGAHVHSVVHRFKGGVRRGVVHHGGGLEQQEILVLRRTRVPMEPEMFGHGAAHTAGKSQSLVRGAETRGLDGLAVQHHRAVEVVGRKEGVEFQGVVQVVGQKSPAHLRVGHKEVAEQIDRDLGTRVHVHNVSNFIPGGLVRIQSHPKAHRRAPGAFFCGELRVQLHNGLVVGPRGVQLRAVQLGFHPDVQPFAPHMAT